MSQMTKAQMIEGSAITPPSQDPKAVKESGCEPVSKPGGFRNDPDDPTNPNEELERHREKLRP